MIERHFVLEREGDRPILGDVRLPEGEPPRSAVVVAHGFKGFKDWGFFPHLCERIAADGHAAVSFNFSHNGIGADPAAFTDLDAFAANTFSREVEEILAVLAEVRGGGILPVPPSRLGLLGHSRGGGDAVIAARDDVTTGGARIDALVTWAAIADYDRWPRGRKKEWREKGRIEVLNSRTGQELPLDIGLLEDFEHNRDHLDIEKAAAEIRELPWLVVHGEDDPTVPLDDAHRLKQANPDLDLATIAEAGHTFEVGHPFPGPSPELERAIQVTLEHFRRYLKISSRSPAREA